MVQGMCSAEVQIYGLENKRITTSVFQYYVRSEFVQDEWIDSTTEYPIMTEIMTELSTITATEDERVKNEQIRQIQENQRVQADTNRETKTNEKIEELNEVQQKANDKMDEIENRFTKLTTSQQQEAEIIDARKGKASLREKIDEIDTNINNKIYADADLFTAMLLQQEVRITALEQGGVI